MDDVDAELDRKRISFLLEYLEGRTQTFVTTSKENFVQQFIARANVYEVNEGEAFERTAHEIGVVSATTTGTESV
jgi:recombinational DNA repair ATPase RecF